MERGLLDDKLRNDCIDQTYVKNRENNWRRRGEEERQWDNFFDSPLSSSPFSHLDDIRNEVRIEASI